MLASGFGLKGDEGMSSVAIWMLGIAASIAFLVISAAVKQPYIHMIITATVALLFALTAIAENRKLRSEGASEALIASSTARHMGLVLVWGALGLFVTYNFILKWREWWHFFVALIAAAGLCLFFAATMKSDAESGKDDAVMHKLGRYMAMVLTGGMFATLIGMIVNGSLLRFMKKHPDWAAQNFFFFGAVALAAIGVNALITSHEARR